MSKKHNLLLVLLFVASVIAGAQITKKFPEGVSTTDLFVDYIRLNGSTISTTETNGHLLLSPNGSGKVELPGLTASTVPYLDANKRLTSSVVTPTQLGYVDFTSSGQTQLNTKLTDPMTTNGDLITRAAGVPARLAIGSANTVLQSSGTAPQWASTLAGLTLTAPTIDAAILDGQGSTPSNPSAGNYKFYIKDSTGTPYILDSSGTETEIIAGGGSTQFASIQLEKLTSAPSSADSGYVKLWVDNSEKAYIKNPSGATTQLGRTQIFAVKPAVGVYRICTVNRDIATQLENLDSAASCSGSSFLTGESVLLPAQINPAENGVYVVPASGAASRHPSFDTAEELSHIGIYSERAVLVGSPGDIYYQPTKIAAIGDAITFDNSMPQQSWTVPPGVHAVKVTMCGGGGGGGGGWYDTTSDIGAGGAGGNGVVPETAVINVTPGETITIDLGEGGDVGPSTATGASNVGSSGLGTTVTYGGGLELSALGGDGGDGAGSITDNGTAGTAVFTAIRRMTAGGAGGDGSASAATNSAAGGGTSILNGGAAGQSGQTAGGVCEAGGGGGGGAGAGNGGAGGLGADSTRDATAGSAGGPCAGGGGGGGGCYFTAPNQRVGKGGGPGGAGMVIIEY